MIVQLPRKRHLLWALGSNCRHGNFKAIGDATLRFQDDRVQLHFMPFVFQDPAKRSVLLDLGLVLVVISYLCYVTN